MIIFLVSLGKKMIIFFSVSLPVLDQDQDLSHFAHVKRVSLGVGLESDLFGRGGLTAEASLPSVTGSSKKL